MILTDQHIDQAFNDLKRGCGGVQEDYFGLLYLEKFLNISRDDAILQVAFGGNDYGLDGYHLEGRLNCPNRRHPRVRSVWQLDEGAVAPRLLTAYPLEAE